MWTALVIEQEFVYETDDTQDIEYVGAPVVVTLAPSSPPSTVTSILTTGTEDEVVGWSVGVEEPMMLCDDCGFDLDRNSILRTTNSTGDGTAVLVAGADPDGATITHLDGSGECSAAEVVLGGDPAAADVNHDGIPEFLAGQLLLDSSCAVVAESGTGGNSLTETIFQTVDGRFVGVTVDGLLDIQANTTTAWPSGPLSTARQYQFAWAVAGSDPIGIAFDGEQWLEGASLDGAHSWRTEVAVRPQALAGGPLVGDIDGDGSAEIVLPNGTAVDVFDPEDGSLRQSIPSGDVALQSGGYALADLDADGAMELVGWTSEGLRILDLSTASVLAEFTDVGTIAAWGYPAVADVDADGSAEIIVVGNSQEVISTHGRESGYNNHLYIFGPATGRWARTRPVWNQTPYDPSVIRDDGTVVIFPPYSGRDYPMYRAQPSHDGDRPDLIPVLLGTCSEDCEAGEIQIEVAVENLGSADAPAGAGVSVSTWATGGLLTERNRITLPEIPSMTRSASVFLTVPRAEWGERRTIEVEGVGDECDHVNDQIDLWEDPCD